MIPASLQEISHPKELSTIEESAHTIKTPPKANTIVEEAEECLAQSLLMFLYADLRLLSATGRINTKFETLCIDSDRVPRTSSAEMAQLPGICSWLSDNSEGVSPAQIMAILIVELRQEVLAQRKRAKEQIKRRENRGWGIGQTDDEDDDESDLEIDDAGVMNKITDKKGRKEFETEMHGLIRSYNDMLSKDLKGIPEVKAFTNPFFRGTSKDGSPGQHRGWDPKAWTKSIIKSRLQSFDESDQIEMGELSTSRADMNQSHGTTKKSITSLLPGPKHRHSRRDSEKKTIEDVKSEEDTDVGDEKTAPASDLDTKPAAAPSTDDKRDRSNSLKLNHSKLFDIIESLRAPKAQQHHECDLNSIKSDPGPNGNDWNQEPTEEYLNMSKKFDEEAGLRRGPMNLTKKVSQYIERTKEDHALYNKVIIPTEDYETFTAAENVGNVLFGKDGETNVKMPVIMDNTDAATVDSGRNMSEKELLDFMTNCIESRNDERLGFMKDFFKDDSISQVMVKSNARVVWLQDWYPIKDCIYAISVDREKKRVLVVFRGAITRPDWNHAFDASLKKSHNPVKDSYEGRSNFIRVHRGFFTYLFRQRKDTSTRKYDEIANKVFEYGTKMIGDDFTVCVNGYSLGGGLATLFGFFASTDERFTRNGPVKIFSYGMPYVASYSFADAFRHQERCKKVQHARFYNHNDIVAHLPFNVRVSRRGATFVHVGVDVKLFPPAGVASLCGSRPPRVRYNKKEPVLASYMRAIKMNSLLNMPFPWQIKSKHALPELQKRLKRAVEISERTSNPVIHKTLDEVYESLVYSPLESKCV